jgi:hypothetical protein
MGQNRNMPIFYLEPKSGHTSDPTWATTSLREGGWVKADSEADARRRIELATLQMADVRPGLKIRPSPWLDPALTSFMPNDHGPDVPEGKIVTRSGRSIDC